MSGDDDLRKLSELTSRIEAAEAEMKKIRDDQEQMSSWESRALAAEKALRSIREVCEKVGPGGAVDADEVRRLTGGLPFRMEDLLTPEQQRELSAALRKMADQRRTAWAEGANWTMRNRIGEQGA